MRLQIGLRADLALKVLRLLAAEERTWKAGALADAVWTTRRFVDDVLLSFERQGWVESTAGGVRYALGAAGPSLLDVIEAIEGPTRRDECVLRAGKVCGWASGEPICALHDAWQRAHASLTDELAATAAVRSRVPVA